ncbi:EamA family transporter [Microbacterium ulmi]|uniref:EamA family transporter n=1 Tax=Microbacterium ulmi TaxID=179095 RepID=A0A7Y2Q295_9MICO|nr:EamA family transporter [Microbacterium ulmi]NII68625.1 inner membrane transporter RhtA [Microbacterium ulmi]NNH04795.1 EamA family transporter [Microbacterium ulmi]
MVSAALPAPRVAGFRALGLVLAASLGVQSSALLAHVLFERLGPIGVSGLRFAIAAVIAAVIVRPRLRGRSVVEWIAIGCFGASIASMNVFLYLALDRLPFGIALTLEFLGPFAVAALGARRPLAALFPVAGLVGVVLVVRPSGALDPIGLLFGALAAAALAAYTLLAERVGRDARGFDGLALAFVFAAVLTAPFALQALPSLQWTDAGILTLAAVLGVVVAFAADFLAVRATSARTVAVMLSFDPVLAALLGVALLAQTLDATTWLGILLVAIAGGGSAALAGRVRSPAPSSAASLST